jgi:hypothetical protein
MGQARDQAGNIWETDAQGNALRLVQAAPSSGGQIFSLPPNPKEVRQEARQTEADARATAAAKREALTWAAEHNPDGTKKDPAETPLPADQMGVTGPDFLAKLSPTDAAQVKALASGRMAFPTGKAAASPYWQMRLQQVAQYDPTFDAINYTARAKTRADFTSGVSARNIKALNTAIGHVGQLANQISGTASHGGFPLATTVNALENTYERGKGDPGITNYAQTAGAVSGELTQVFRGSGGAEADIQRYLNELDPNASAQQKQAAVSNILTLLKSRLDALNDQYTKGMGTSAGGLQVLDPHAVDTLQQHLPGFNAADYGGPSGPSDSGTPGAPSNGGTPPNDGGTPSIATGPTKTTYDARTSSQIDAMINAGANKGMIDAVLKRQNFPIVSAGEWRNIQNWRAKNPGQKYYGANISHTDDLSLGQRLAASAPAAGFAHAVNAATAGTAGALGGPQTQGALDAMAAVHPDASATGDVAGGVLGAMGAEGAVAARAPAALAQYAPRIADALYGGALGFNTARDGEGGTGALVGAGAGLLGGNCRPEGHECRGVGLRAE